MAVASKKAFSFTSESLPENTFSVVRFKGEEGLSTLYRFEILLVSKKDNINALDVVQNSICLTLEHKDGKLPFHGIPESFEQLQNNHGLTFYRAMLVPKLWWLTLTQHNQVFLNKTCPQFLQQVLQDGGLENGKDFELRLRGNYPAWEYICQYGESHFAFVSRWMERYGMYYFFEQEDVGEKLIITDDASFHNAIPGGGSLRFAPQSGLEAPYVNEIVTALRCEERLLPKKVLLKDYNYEKPSLSIEADAEVSSQGEGVVYSWGEHLRTPDEAKGLAKVRAQELSCRGALYYGRSSVSLLRSGFTCSLQHHFYSAANQEYLLLKVVHEGNQAASLTAGLGGSEETKGLYYRNSFIAIPTSVQYRPERLTPRPRFQGVLNAHIDAAGSGQYAELDDQGRYKVILPFDLSGRKDGKASSWLRMMQPYAGDNHGLHFPLHKGTEVILGFIEGDPDRPFIVSAVPNPAQKSLVTSAGNTKCMLTTSGNNIMHIEDKQGSERILMRTPTSETYLRLGEPNDPPSSKWEKEEDKPGWKLQTNDAFEVYAGTENEVIMIENSVTVIGGREKYIAIFATEINIGDYFVWQDPFAKKWSPIMSYLHGNVQKAIGTEEKLGEENLEIANNVLKMRQMRQKLAEQETALKLNTTKLRQQKTSLQESAVSVNESKEHMEQVSSRVQQDNGQLGDTVVRLGDVKINAVEQKNAAAETLTRLQTETSKLAQAQTEMIDSVTHMTATRDRVIENVVTVVDIATKV